MAQIKHGDRRIIEDLMEMGSGYVLNFNNTTFSEFFEDECRIDIYAEVYAFRGSSKANRLRAFMEVESSRTVAHALKKLWGWRCETPIFQQDEKHDRLAPKLLRLIADMAAEASAADTDTIEQFVADETLEELIASIRRDLELNKPSVVLDRLHTYSMKKFSHFLQQREIACERNEPLQSRVGKYVKAIKTERNLQDVTEQIVKNSISVFEKYNHVRNNGSLAHDNTLLAHAEARFVYDSITAFLRFVKAIEADRFGA